MIGKNSSASESIFKKMVGLLDLYRSLPLGGLTWSTSTSPPFTKVMNRCPFDGKRLTRHDKNTEHSAQTTVDLEYDIVIKPSTG